MQNGNVILTASHLNKTYSNKYRKVKVLRDVSTEFESARFYCVIGKSGCGKSTLLHILAGMRSPDEGTVLYHGLSLYTLSDSALRQFRSKDIGFVLQNYGLLPELTIEENIRLPSILSQKEIDQNWYKELLHRLGLENLTESFPDELSGGQQQRCAIGRAVILQPMILFADEPTGNLDKRTSAEVLDLLLEIRDSYGPSVIMATHDLDIARCADAVLYMENGKLKKEGSL